MAFGRGALVLGDVRIRSNEVESPESADSIDVRMLFAIGELFGIIAFVPMVHVIGGDLSFSAPRTYTDFLK